MKHRKTIWLLAALLFAPGLHASDAATDSCIVFSSVAGTEAVIASAIDSARERIRIAMYSFTNPVLTDALLKAHRRGMDVRIKLDRLQSSSKYQQAEIKRLTDAGVHLVVSKHSRVMHHKFLVVDGAFVATGSYNWTRSAESSNKENAVVLFCKATAARYEEEWEAIE